MHLKKNVSDLLPIQPNLLPIHNFNKKIFLAISTSNIYYKEKTSTVF
jgi:hypothetical protein